MVDGQLTKSGSGSTFRLILKKKLTERRKYLAKSTQKLGQMPSQIYITKLWYLANSTLLIKQKSFLHLQVSIVGIKKDLEELMWYKHKSRSDANSNKSWRQRILNTQNSGKNWSGWYPRDSIKAKVNGVLIICMIIYIRDIF